MKYLVQSVKRPMTIDGDWNKSVWQEVQAIELTHHMGDRPKHFPIVRAKVRCDSANLYVIFRVEDRYVRAVATEHQGSVWEDSCVEFFFTPGAHSRITSAVFPTRSSMAFQSPTAWSTSTIAACSR